MLTPGHVLKNYKAFIEYFKLPYQTSSTARRKQEEYVLRFVTFTKMGHKYIIHSNIKPYEPPPRAESPFMEITEQLIHEILLRVSGFYKKSKYGLANTCVLTFVEGFEMTGLARKGWTYLRNGTDMDTVELRKAYDIHYNLCKARWVAASNSLVKASIINRDEVYVIIEGSTKPDGAYVEYNRLAEADEIPDCQTAISLAFDEIKKKYPDLKINGFPDLYFNFKEKEFHKIRQRIFQEAVDRWTINCNRPAYTIFDFYRASRFTFTDQSLARYKAPIHTKESVQQMQVTVAQKLHDWYHLPQNEDKLSTVRPFLFSLLDLVGEPPCE
jgi:hypothetical protein